MFVINLIFKTTAQRLAMEDAKAEKLATVSLLRQRQGSCNAATTEMVPAQPVAAAVPSGVQAAAGFPSSHNAAALPRHADFTHTDVDASRGAAIARH